ncbi:hypothetical protein F3Y22_tig00006570pilonHSYRG00127 [Hibiscus syriacus]|uniref:Secoisolariciresinol dehydrogenase n=1 Tax=Hibiscus syriacus TaxID=106335 RepID=A0A6A3CBU4_HIBSY|nr:hypothetical protein F3Y22_tig00006570pilonHSYRG00127 [Hibiscus syriacus]
MSSQSSVTKRLDGKVALITGGASGLGECTARLFVKHGAKVLVADIQDDLGHSLCQDLGTENIGYVHCDVTCESDVENAVNLVVSKYGKLDIMFNNAGIIGDNEVRVTDTSTENFKRVFDINVLGGFLGAKHAARVMVPAKKGCILFTSSEHGIRVNCISPHATATPLFQKTLGLFDKKGREMIAASAVLKGTVLEPEDFANAALFWPATRLNM